MRQLTIYNTLTLGTNSNGTCARMLVGNSTTSTSYTAGTAPLTMYFTAAGSGTTNCEPIYVKSTLTGTSPVGGRARFHCYANVTTGGWVNALKSYMEFGSSGRVTGLASSMCVEMVMPNVDITAAGGAYYPLEIEYVAGGSGLTTAGSPGGNQVGFIYMNASGDTDGDFDDNGYFLRIDGVTAGDGHVWDNSVSAATGDNGLRCLINGAEKWILVADDNT